MSIDPQKSKILLVEDTATMRRIEARTLKALGFEKIIEAEDGDAAITKLQEQDGVDLIISDWNMPRKDGYELLVWVRAVEKYKNIPFLMATGQGDKKQEQKAVDAGVSSFVAKPFSADELKSKIDEAFGIKQNKEDIPEQKTSLRETASGKVRLKIAHIQITDHLILGVLNHQIKNGKMSPKYFDLEIQCMPGWNPVKEALEKGTVDAACILAPIAMDLFSFGVPIKLIMLAHKSGSIFVRSKQGKYIEPFQDFFKSKSFFIPHKMSVHHMLAHMFFSKIGVKSGMGQEDDMDVNFEVVAPIKMPDFLRNNPDACGFMVAEPLGTKAIASGIVELQFLSNELWENHPCCVVAMRDDFIERYTDAVYEFTEMLVEAGKFIEKMPEMSAEIAVDFLDPNKKLGLKVPILKNVLTEAQGIKSGDLFPVVEELDKIQQYMFKNMGIGSLIDLEKFVDTRFAEAACKDSTGSSRPSSIHDTDAVALEILQRGAIEKGKTAKSLLNKEGEYLIFVLGDQEFGIDIFKIKEILAMTPIRTIPQSPAFVKGVINIRGKVIPVMDLRLRFGMEEFEYTERSCIIVLEFGINGNTIHLGITVDRVLEVRDFKVSEIEETAYFGPNIDTSYILAMAKTEKGVNILIDIDRVLNCNEIEMINDVL